MHCFSCYPLRHILWNGRVWVRHCITELKKHVFPRLCIGNVTLPSCFVEEDDCPSDSFSMSLSAAESFISSKVQVSLPVNRGVEETCDYCLLCLIFLAELNLGSSSELSSLMWNTCGLIFCCPPPPFYDDCLNEFLALKFLYSKKPLSRSPLL